MSAIVKSPPTRPAIEILIEAVNWALLQGYPVRLDRYGVLCASSLVDIFWEKDRLIPGIDPLGAAILMRQPQKADIVDAAAEVLGESIPFVEGLADGLGLQPKASAWLRPTTRYRYERGYETGANLRIAILSRTCAEHGRYGLDQLRCPSCQVKGQRVLGLHLVRGEG